jgi:hypothetical protein
VCPPGHIMTGNGYCIPAGGEQDSDCPPGQMLSEEGGCIPEDGGGEAPVCPNGFVMSEAGECIPVEQIPGPDVGCPPGFYYDADGNCSALPVDEPGNCCCCGADNSFAGGFYAGVKKNPCDCTCGLNTGGYTGNPTTRYGAVRVPNGRTPNTTRVLVTNPASKIVVPNPGYVFTTRPTSNASAMFYDNARRKVYVVKRDGDVRMGNPGRTGKWKALITTDWRASQLLHRYPNYVARKCSSSVPLVDPGCSMVGLETLPSDIQGVTSAPRCVCLVATGGAYFYPANVISTECIVDKFPGMASLVICTGTSKPTGTVTSPKQPNPRSVPSSFDPNIPGSQIPTVPIPGSQIPTVPPRTPAIGGTMTTWTRS